jgi:hypothetical protein
MSSNKTVDSQAYLQQQIGALNTRANSANLAYNDLLKETANTIKAMASTILMLQQENTDLKKKTAKE